MGTNQTPRCVVIGIDGATFKLIQPLAEQGKLPNIARLMSCGVHGNLRSGIPQVSPSLWSSIITGKNPGKHGIYDFIINDYSNTGFGFNSSLDRKAKAVWSYLGESGKRVCVGSLLLTYPPDKVNGCMVSDSISAMLNKGGDGIRLGATYPPTLQAEIAEKIGSYELQRKSKRIQGLLEDMKRSVDYRIRLYRFLSEKEPFDFEFYYFSETDLLSHWAWKHLENGDDVLGQVIGQLYEHIDQAIDPLVNRENTNVILISDHGFCEVKKTVSLNTILEAAGLLTYKSNTHPVLKKLRHLYKKGRNFILKKQDPFLGLNLHDFLSSVDWDKTRAYHLGSSCGTIYVNLKGREKMGSVPVESYEQVCRDIVRTFESMVDEQTGEKIVKKVHLNKEVFSGDQTVLGPDIYVEFAQGYGVGIKKDIRNSKTNGIAEAKLWSGDHDENGIFIAAGPQFKQGAVCTGARVLDIAPTVLYVMGQPIPEEMDGKVLAEAIDREYARDHDPVFVREEDKSKDNPSEQVYTDTDRDNIAQRLKDLGYME